MGGGPRLIVEVKPRSGPPRATAGSPVRLRGNAFDKDGRPVEIRWGNKDGAVLAAVPVDQRGEFISTVRVPPDAAVGTYLVTATQRRIDDTEVSPSQLSIDVVADESQATVSDGTPVVPDVEDDRPGWLVPALLGVAALLGLGLVVARIRRGTENG